MYLNVSLFRNYMQNFINKYIKCPKCSGEITITFKKEFFCNKCEAKFYNYDGIVDFRNIDSDKTRGVPIQEDILIGKILLRVSKKVNYYNGLLFIYDKISILKNLDQSKDKIDQIVKEALYYDLPMSKEQSIHGYDILKKIDLYRQDFNFDNYQKKICLENGSGQGLFVEGLSKKFDNILIIDFSLSYLVLAKKICYEKRLYLHVM